MITAIIGLIACVAGVIVGGLVIRWIYEREGGRMDKAFTEGDETGSYHGWADGQIDRLKGELRMVKGRLNAAYGKMRAEPIYVHMETPIIEERIADSEDHWQWNDTLGKWFPPKWIMDRNDTLTLWCNGVMST